VVEVESWRRLVRAGGWGRLAIGISTLVAPRWTGKMLDLEQSGSLLLLGRYFAVRQLLFVWLLLWRGEDELLRDLVFAGLVIDGVDVATTMQYARRGWVSRRTVFQVILLGGTSIGLNLATAARMRGQRQQQRLRQPR
jgi:hypothetical protein